jgi:hypothetical protein
LDKKCAEGVAAVTPPGGRFEWNTIEDPTCRLDVQGDARAQRNRHFAPRNVEAIIVKTLETTPKGRTHWSTRKMASQVGISHTMVGQIWRTFGLKPHRRLSFKLSPDPQLVREIRDIVGLYMNPPANAAVFAVDEKS